MYGGPVTQLVHSCSTDMDKCEKPNTLDKDMNAVHTLRDTSGYFKFENLPSDVN